MLNIEKKLEKEIEKKAVKEGCLRIKIYKKHYPDRLYCMPNGRVVFIEFKRLGEQLNLGQKLIQSKLKDLGFEVYTIFSINEFLEIISNKKGESK